jgi:hypothetical protein
MLDRTVAQSCVVLSHDMQYRADRAFSESQAMRHDIHSARAESFASIDVGLQPAMGGSRRLIYPFFLSLAKNVSVGSEELVRGLQSDNDLHCVGFDGRVCKTIGLFVAVDADVTRHPDKGGFRVRPRRHFQQVMEHSRPPVTVTYFHGFDRAQRV